MDIAGDKHWLLRQNLFERLDFRFAGCQGQLDLTALHDGSEHAHGDFKALVGAFAIAGMHLFVIVQPAGHVFDVRGHFEVVVHAAGAGNHALLSGSDGSPAGAGQNLGEALGAVDSDLVFAPPIVDFRNVRGASAAFNDAADAVGELNESTYIVGRRMIVGELAAPRGLGHDPFGARVAVVPAHVFDKMREKMEEPSGRVGMDGVDAAEGATVHNFLDLLIVLAVTVLVRHNGLDPRGVDRLANLDGLVHGKGHGFFVGDQLCPGSDAHLDKFQPDAWGGAETENIRLNFFGESERLQRSLMDAELRRGLGQLLRAGIREPG